MNPPAANRGVRDYDQEARDQREHAYAYEFDYIMHGFIMRTFERYFVDGSALELGCFKGHFTRRLRARFVDLSVVEASGECISEARRTAGPGVEFHHARFEDFKAPKAYDNILLVHTLEHLDDRVGMLKCISSWLSPRGRAFVATPNAFAASRQIAVNMGLIESPTAVTPAEHAHGHRVTYSLDALVADVEAAGIVSKEKGGICFKALANFQMDAALAAGTISMDYLEGCFQLGLKYPQLCSSIYVVGGRH
jgi:2-polyprenyl-3-methyl-5-hydroxy-6-metoxy-1,4-benzoquinol methylase